MIYLNLTKLLLSLIPFSILGSISMRSAKIDTCCFDYEYVYGCKTRFSDTRFLYERENSKYYLGRDLKLDIWWLHFRDIKREGNSIDNQTLNLLWSADICPQLNFSWGGGMVASKYDFKRGNGVVCAGVDLTKYVSSEFKSNFDNRHILDFQLKGKPIEIGRGFFLTPKFIYYFTDNTVYFQAKMFLEFKL